MPGQYSIGTSLSRWSVFNRRQQDDWGLAKLTAEQRRDLLEILEDRHGSRSTIVTSQLPLDQWHASIGDSTLADAIMDRLVHNAYKIKLEGDSLRKQQANLTTTNEIE